MSKILVVGQGIAGISIAHYLRKRNCHVYTIDDMHSSSASRVAAGMVNPVTGRSYVKSWMIEALITEVYAFYKEIESLLSLEDVIKSTAVIRTLPDQAAENKWYHRLEDPAYCTFLDQPSGLSDYDEIINPVFNAGRINHAYQIDLRKLVDAYTERFTEWHLSHSIDYSALQIDSEKIMYHSDQYDYVIFAEGYKGMHNPYFSFLPFQPAKGEVLLIRIPGFKTELVLRHKIFLIPLEDDLFWVGAGYNWDIDDVNPSQKEANRLISILDDILKVPYEIVDHRAGVRPATKGRRPFLGRHPEHNRLAIFNGMGTKGASLSPYWAKHFVNHLLDGIELNPEVDISRF